RQIEFHKVRFRHAALGDVVVGDLTRLRHVLVHDDPHVLRFERGRGTVSEEDAGEGERGKMAHGEARLGSAGSGWMGVLDHNRGGLWLGSRRGTLRCLSLHRSSVMRALAVALLVAFAAPAPVSAADTDKDKAKEAALAFLKAVKKKDADAVMKTTAAPFVF